MIAMNFESELKKRISVDRAFDVLVVAESCLPGNHQIRERLEIGNLSIVQAANRQIAIRSIRNKIPDLILIDLNMNKQEGIALLKTIRISYSMRELPVIIMASENMNIVEALSSGANDYFMNSVDSVDLDVLWTSICNQLLQEKPVQQFSSSQESLEKKLKCPIDLIK